MCFNNYSASKHGLKGLGYVTNLSSCVKELNEFLPKDSPLSFDDITGIVDASAHVYLNKYGKPSDKSGNPIPRETASYLYFETGLQNSEGADIIGWFSRVNKKGFLQGVTWGTKEQLETLIRRCNMFHIDEICFEHFSDGQAFLEDIAASAIPETWSFKNRATTVNHPILKSYLENIFKRLKCEAKDGKASKIVYSRDRKYLLFNSNLLDKFFHEILIVAEFRKQRNGETLLMNPRRVHNRSKLMALGFERDVKAVQPSFFENVEEVIFQPSWLIERDFDTFSHIIEDRLNRFPVEMQREPSDTLARKLDDAITFAVAIAQRNFKFIVPMYRPQENKIQLLMPIYLKGSYSSLPDFALVMSADKANQMYIPETILPLEAVYQDARLIAKPDDTWLNPDTILFCD